MPRDFAEDYVPVAERVAHFYEKYPEGSIQTEVIELADVRVTVQARAYRTADDARPAIGHSWLTVPGSTPFTRGSEIENAETSAVGRALAFLGFDTHRGLASREEVDGKRTDAAAAPRTAQEPRQRPQPTSATPEAGPAITDDDFAGLLDGPKPTGGCPVHSVPWKLVPAGVSKAGKPYDSFLACPEFGCREKPARKAA